VKRGAGRYISQRVKTCKAGRSLKKIRLTGEKERRSEQGKWGPPPSHRKGPPKGGAWEGRKKPKSQSTSRKELRKIKQPRKGPNSRFKTIAKQTGINVRKAKEKVRRHPEGETGRGKRCFPKRPRHGLPTIVPKKHLEQR